MTPKQVARKVANHYARKCWWAEFDDLYQEARIACLQAERCWSEEVGVPLDAYCWVCAKRAVSRWCLRNSSIASASWRDVGELANHRREQLHDSNPDLAPWAEQLLHDKRWRESVRGQVMAVLRNGGLRSLDRRLALEMLVAGYTTKEVAEAYALPSTRVSRAGRQARRLLCNDLQCYRFWKEV